jgi:aminopeptidase N
MSSSAPQTIHLKDYSPVSYAIHSVDLAFDLHPTATRVSSRLAMAPNPASTQQGGPLVLSGEQIRLIRLAIDGKELAASAYSVDAESLTITAPPQTPFTLEIETECNPQGNTALSGLYLSNGVFCTQCEAEGFRRITYFHDRPDVMATYRVTITAPKATCPVMLSNGNPGAVHDLAGTDKHVAIWHDPHPKPSYLFALVAGDLASVTDTFLTASGRRVGLGIYVEPGKEDRCAWAMECLKQSMRWDETRFGREYDLDVFNIVAVSDFNMGAMENKGLNVFNDKYILALPETATDTDYVNIEAIIAHEYFHNWTGNRITCRDWFQLCLKEGLTVFRDQEFTSDLRSRPVKRIADVRTLRARQFPEDGGPLAHPARPSSYIEINNFYTPTVYEKGAEICRMMLTLIGEKAFRRAMDIYFERHDGEAATVEDFVRCMADASGRDLSQFFSWYEQAGTPVITAEAHYDAQAKTYDLTLEQATSPTPGQTEKKAMHIPLGIGLLGSNGEDMPLHLEGTGSLNTPLIELREGKKTFRFTDVRERPVLSLNRGFSAPVIIKTEASPDDLVFQMGHDSDSFNRWEAGQNLARSLLIGSVRAVKANRPAPEAHRFAAALRRTLSDGSLDAAFKAQMLALPTEQDIAAAIGHDADTDAILSARDHLRRQLGLELRNQIDAILKPGAEHGAYVPDTVSTARRSLYFAALSLLAASDPAEARSIAAEAIAGATNMTVELGALSALLLIDCPERQAELDAFHERHRHDHLLIDKWLLLNAQIPGAGSASRIETLLQHPDFKLTTPNRVYALIGGFTSGNMAGFNAADGEGYRVVAETIIALDAINPQVAARVATAFRSWRLFDMPRRREAQTNMQRILATPDRSRDVYEIISRTLQV